jgi:menaquinone-9 beta-reductase
LLDETRVTGYRLEPDHIVVAHQRGSLEQRSKVRLLIGADGSASIISRILRGGPPLRRDRIVAVRAYFEDVEGPQDQADLYFSASTFPGYSWLFPTGGASANVGVGTLMETWPPVKQQLNEVLTGILQSDPAIRFRLGSARMRGKVVGWPLTTFNPNQSIVGDRVILIGDAAGLINPLNGEGIQYALQSARWAAETLGRCLQRDDLEATQLAAYARRVQHELRYDMALARLIVDLISNRTLNPLWLQALRVITQRAAFDKDYAKLAGGILAGIAPARDALSYRILWGTLQHAAIHTGYAFAIHALKGPGQLCKAGTETARTTVSIAVESLLRPTTSLSWGLHCALSAAELAVQITASAFEPRATARVDAPRGTYVQL